MEEGTKEASIVVQLVFEHSSMWLARRGINFSRKWSGSMLLRQAPHLNEISMGEEYEKYDDTIGCGRGSPQYLSLSCVSANCWTRTGLVIGMRSLQYRSTVRIVTRDDNAGIYPGWLVIDLPYVD